VCRARSSALFEIGMGVILPAWWKMRTSGLEISLSDRFVAST